MSALFSWLLSGIRLPLVLASVALVIYAVFFANPYDMRILTLCGIYVLLVLGFQFVFGHAGAVSLAQATFFGIGGYITGIVATYFGAGFLVTFPLSIAAPVLLAVVVAVPVLKLEEHYFSLATLGIGLVVLLLAIQWSDITGGTNGLPGIPSIDLAGLVLSDRRSVLYFVWSLVLVGCLISYQVTRGLYGRAFHLMREDRVAASALGVNIAHLRFAAFVLSAAYGGAAGALMAHVIHVVSPENLDLALMVTCLTMTVIGGRTRIAGAILGAILIVFLREWFRVLENYYMIAYGVAALSVLILAPYGLVGALERLRVLLFGHSQRPKPPSVSEQAPQAALAEKYDHILAARDVTLGFGGVRALDGVSFDLRDGEIVGLIGPNGSGKTTLLNVISGLYVCEHGQVTFRGQDITRSPAHIISRRGIARTFQHIHLVDDLSALDNIALARAGIDGTGLFKSITTIGGDRRLERARRIALAAAERLGIANVVMEPCGGLPYGTRRRVEVARAIATGPALVLLDEPAAGLNEQEQLDLAERIKTFAADGITVVVVEHNLVFLAALAERLICLDRGKVIAAGSPDAVRRDPGVIEAYLGLGASEPLPVAAGVS
ncbi:ABC transporter permease subunit [Bradyrhizobium sp.]|jgi:branched-chain amino acid transport system permease protein|uniref:branched-chain amino acid ABC transporter ATP-binding protein/permease n=1 Tax=Bradyrhizobium sp. TaxID=376 RepID=UPI003C23F0E7